MSTYGVTCEEGDDIVSTDEDLKREIVLLSASVTVCMPENGQSDCQIAQYQKASYSLPACPQQTCGAA